jgi:predicted site-specific integrase-resolvase
MTEKKEELIEQLKQIQDEKQKAVTAQSYEMASALRDREKEILKKIDDFNENDEKHSR